ncbi:hypothetical protein EC968_010020, partial [Mortierella alpina]
SEAARKITVARRALPVTLASQPGVTFPSINELEALVPSRSQPGLAHVLDNIRWYNGYQHLLRSFYSSSWWKRHQWDNAKAQRAESGRVFDAIARSVNGASRSDTLQNDPATGYCKNLAIVIGNGDFKSGFGKTSKHTAMTRDLVLQARGHGVLVFQVNEAYTSSRCPRGHHELIKYQRSVECRKCSIVIHRDSAGSHNIAFIGREHMQGRPRPNAFSSIPEDAIDEAPVSVL